MTAGVDVQVKIDWTALGRDLAGGSSLEQAGLLNALGARLRELGHDGLMQSEFIRQELDGGGVWLVDKLTDYGYEYNGE